MGYGSNGKEICKTLPAYVAGKDNPVYTNAKSIKLSKKKLTVAIGKKKKIKAKIKLDDKSKKNLSVKRLKICDINQQILGSLPWTRRVMSKA